MSSALISVIETAGLLGVSDDLVYDLIKRGELPSIKTGRRRLVPRAAVELVIDRAMDGFDPDRLLASLASAADSSSATETGDGANSPGLPSGESASCVGESAGAARGSPPHLVAVRP